MSHGSHKKGHQLKVSEKRLEDKGKKSKFCIAWNRGHCRYADSVCRFSHREIPACHFQAYCKKTHCKFYHEPYTGLFPLVKQYPMDNIVNGSNFLPKTGLHSYAPGRPQWFPPGHQRSQLYY